MYNQCQPSQKGLTAVSELAMSQSGPGVYHRPSNRLLAGYKTVSPYATVAKIMARGNQAMPQLNP